MYPIDRYQITGIENMTPGNSATYTITGDTKEARVDWEISSNGATITSGQGTKSITVLFNQSNYYTIYANIRFYESGTYYIRAAKTLVVNVNYLPTVFDITMSKYMQGDGEYTLGALVANGDGASTQWYCDGNATMYEIQYPDDASFAHNPNLFKAIDFYSSGTYNIGAYAYNSTGYGGWFYKSFQVNDSKNTMFPMSISPNPMSSGTNPELEIRSSSVADTELTVDIYSEGKKVHQIKTKNKKSKINFSNLKKGKYNVVVKDGKVSHNTVLQVI